MIIFFSSKIINFDENNNVNIYYDTIGHLLTKKSTSKPVTFFFVYSNTNLLFYCLKEECSQQTAYLFKKYISKQSGNISFAGICENQEIHC